MKWNYKIYGLGIESCIEFPFLQLYDGAIDIKVQYSIVPNALSDIQFKSGFFETNGKSILIKSLKFSKVLILNRHEIIVEPPGQMDEMSYFQFFLGPVLSAMLHLRGIMPLHASSVINDNQAILIAGNSGAGKSTIAHKALMNGYSMVTDDISAIDFEDPNYPKVWTGPPLIKLWGIDQSSSVENKKLVSLGSGTEKKGILMHSLPLSKSYKFDHIYIIQPKNIEQAGMYELSGIQKFEMLNSMIYRPYFRKGLNLESLQFEQITNLAKNKKTICIERPLNKDTTDLIFNWIIEESKK